MLIKKASSGEEKWHKTTIGKIIQICIWPLGLFMMYKVPYFQKSTRYIITGIFFAVIAMQTLTPTNTCSCVGSIYNFNDGSVQYRACIKKHLNAAFKYYEKNDPTREFSSSEALVQQYIIENCDK